MIAFRAFGVVAASGPEGPLRLGGPKQRLLLARLLADPGTTVGSGEIVDVLWRSTPPTKALTSVRAYVSNLRRQFAAVDGRPRIVSRGHGYALDLSADDTVDLVDFAAAAARGRDLARAGDLAAAESALVEAVDTYRGEPFAEFGDAEFARQASAAADVRRRTALDDLFELSARRGEPGRHLALMTDTVNRHPLHEPFWRHLMIALHATGRTGEALQAYDRASAILLAEVGTVPGADLRELAQRIGDRDPSLLTPRPGMIRRPATRSFVGRTRELRVVAETVDAARAGRGGLVVVTGPSGIGKTTLAEQVVVDAGDDFAVGWAGQPAGLRPPRGWAWTQVLRQVVTDPAERERLGRVKADALSSLLPKWTEGLAVPGIPAASDFEFASGVVDVIATLAVDRPLLVVLDDVHRADPASLDALALLADRIAGRPVAVIVIWSGSDLDPRLRSTRGTVVRLGGLDVGATAELAGVVAEEPLTAADARAVWESTGGNPLYVKELVRVAGVDGAPSGVPDTLVDVIGARLDACGQDSLDVLAAAAVIGAEADVAVVAELTGRDVAHVHEAFAAPVATEIVHLAGPRTYRFAHGLLRDATIARTSLAVLQRLHAGAVAVHRAHASPARTPAYEAMVAAAHHAWEAGAYLSPVDTVQVITAALDRALVRCAHRDIALLSTRVIDIVEREPETPVDDGILAGLWLNVAGAASIIDGQSSDAVERAVTRAWELGDDQHVAAALHCLVLCGRGALDEAQSLAQRMVDGDGRPSAGSLFVQIGLAMLRGDAARGRRLAETFFADYEPPDTVADPTAFFHPRVHGYLAVSEALDGRATAARLHVREGADLALARGDGFNALVARLTAVEVAAILDEPDGVADASSVLAAELRTAGSPQWAACADIIGYWARARTGAPFDTGVVRDAVAVYTADGSTAMLPMFLVLAAEVEMIAGRPDMADRILSRARTVADRTGEHAWDGLIHRTRRGHNV